MATYSRHSIGWREASGAPAKRPRWTALEIAGAAAVAAGWLGLLWWSLGVLLDALR